VKPTLGESNFDDSFCVKLMATLETKKKKKFKETLNRLARSSINSKSVGGGRGSAASVFD